MGPGFCLNLPILDPDMQHLIADTTSQLPYKWHHGIQATATFMVAITVHEFAMYCI